MLSFHFIKAFSKQWLSQTQGANTVIVWDLWEADTEMRRTLQCRVFIREYPCDKSPEKEEEWSRIEQSKTFSGRASQQLPLLGSQNGSSESSYFGLKGRGLSTSHQSHQILLALGKVWLRVKWLSAAEVIPERSDHSMLLSAENTPNS